MVDGIQPGPVDIARRTILQNGANLAIAQNNVRARQDGFVAALADSPFQMNRFPAYWAQLSQLPTRQFPNYNAMQPALRDFAVQQEMAYLFPPQQPPFMMQSCMPQPFMDPFMMQSCMPQSFMDPFMMQSCMPQSFMSPFMNSFMQQPFNQYYMSPFCRCTNPYMQQGFPFQRQNLFIQPRNPMNRTVNLNFVV